MIEEPLTLYKLIILYMLDRVSFPLTTAQISEFILGHEYTTFMTLQQAITELMEAKLISAHSTANRTHISITDEGSTTLQFFGDRISSAIKDDVIKYMNENEMALRNDVSIIGEYYKSTSGEYDAHLVAMDRDIKLVDITLSVPTEENAAAICTNWQTKNQEIYMYLIQELF